MFEAAHLFPPMFCNSYTSHVNKTKGSKNDDEKQEHKANNIKTLILSPSRPFHVKTDTHFIVQRAFFPTP